jgi:hypothetical protein
VWRSFIQLPLYSLEGSWVVLSAQTLAISHQYSNEVVLMACPQQGAL